MKKPGKQALGGSRRWRKGERYMGGKRTIWVGRRAKGEGWLPRDCKGRRLGLKVELEKTRAANLEITGRGGKVAGARVLRTEGGEMRPGLGGES